MVGKQPSETPLPSLRGGTVATAGLEDPGPAVDDVENFSTGRKKVKCGCGAVFGPNTSWMKTKEGRGGIVQPNHPQCKQCGDDNRENHAYLSVSEYLPPTHGKGDRSAL